MIYEDDSCQNLPFLDTSTAPLKDEVYFLASWIWTGPRTTFTYRMWQKWCSDSFESGLKKTGCFYFFPNEKLFLGTQLPVCNYVALDRPQWRKTKASGPSWAHSQHSMPITSHECEVILDLLDFLPPVYLT